MPSLEGAGDKGAGQANFDIKDLGMLGATLAKFMGPAEASAAQHFGAKDLMLPYANSENQQV
jgi:hypothetical protein